jgi:hypothetical protein
MDDPQVELLLLRACLESVKMTYLNRVIPTHTVLPHATAFDVSMRACLAPITQGNISDAAWSQAGLPLARGGLGLTHNTRICSATFISSSNMTTDLVENLVIQDAHTIIPDPALPQAIEHYESLMTSDVGDSTTQTQSTLTLALHSRARATLLAGADLRNNAPLLSLTLPQAHSWLLAVPYKPTLQLSPNEFRQAARYRLGVSDHNHQGNLRCRQCDKVQNPRDQGLSYGDHSTQCRGGGSILRRHTRLKIIIYHTLKAASYSPRMETAHLIPGSLIHPGDVYVPVGDDMAVAYDVTVVSLVVESSLSSSARSVGFAADTAEGRKAAHYAITCSSQRIQFIPLAQETLGGWSTQARKILSLLPDRIVDRKGLQRATCRSALCRELGIATQRSMLATSSSDQVCSLSTPSRS